MPDDSHTQEVVLLRDEQIRANDIARPHLRRIAVELEDAYPGRGNDMVAVVVAATLAGLAACEGYGRALPTIINAVVAQDPHFRWRLVDARS